MRRIYVIMEDLENCGTRDSAEPIDFKESMAEAEAACVDYETQNPENIYYWREVIGG